jgi:hypothetical protein
MSSETANRNTIEKRATLKNGIKNTARISVAAGTLFLPSVATAQSESEMPLQYNNSIVEQKPCFESDLHVVYTSSSADQTKAQELSKDEALHDLLEQEYMRVLLVAGFTAALAMGVDAHLHGTKYDENKMHALRVMTPALFGASMAAFGVDSMTTIDRHIPTSLLVGAAFTYSAYKVLSTFEHEGDIKTRAAAIAVSTSLFAASIAAFTTIHQM